MAKGGEAAVKDDVKAYLTSIGAYWFMPVQTGYGRSTLDFLVCHKGCFYGIETKRPGVIKPSSRQQLVINQIQNADGRAFVADSAYLVSCWLK